MRVRPFTFFLSVIVLLTVLNIIFVYESTRNATYDDQTKERGQILAHNYVAFRDTINTLMNETQGFIPNNALNDTTDAFADLRQHSELENGTVSEYIPVGKTESIKLTFQDLFEQLVNTSHKDNENNSREYIDPFQFRMLSDTNGFIGKNLSVANLSIANISFSLSETHVTDLIRKTVKWYYDIKKGENYNHHCGRCALVTSSGRLLNQRVGAEIDSADCVIRMNDAPVIGFVNDVGLRTDIRVMGHPNLATLKENPDKLLEIFYKNATRTKFLLVPWLYSATVNKTTNKYYAILRNLTQMFPDVRFYVPSNDAMDAAESIFEFEIGLKRSKVKTWFTTGWQTMLLSISICDQITVYGMPQVSHCSNSSDRTPYHYYDEHGKMECDYYMRSERRLDTGHIFLTEKAVFSRWAQKFNITFQAPTWNLTSSEHEILDTPFIQAFNRALERSARLERERQQWRERIRLRRERRANAPTEEPLYFLLFSVTLLVVVLKGCDILTFVVTAIVPQSWQDL